MLRSAARRNHASAAPSNSRIGGAAVVRSGRDHGRLTNVAGYLTGTPCKDTCAPAINILIEVITIVSLVVAAAFV